MGLADSDFHLVRGGNRVFGDPGFLVPCDGNNHMFGHGWGSVAFLVLPEDLIEVRGSGGVRAGEVHFCRIIRAAGVALVDLVD